MTAFLIVVAIYAAVALVFKYAVPRRKPNFSSGERLTRNALLCTISDLSKRCAVTESGFGISGRGVKPRRIFSVFEKDLAAGVTLDDWCIAAYNAQDLILAAYARSKNAERKSYSIGHVNGMPRLYMLCNELVRGTQADITVEKFTAAVAEFEKQAPLSSAERFLLIDMMRFSLCGFFYTVAESAQKRADIFAHGLADGAIGKVDLDNIAHGDYVCGLTRSTREKDRSAVYRLLEINGVDSNGAELSRREHLATVFAEVKSVIASLEMLNKLDYGKYESQGTLPLRTPDKTFLRVYAVAPIIVIAIAAVLTCMYASSAYIAVFTVAAIAVYARFRLPIMLEYPQCVFLQLFGSPRDRAMRGKKRRKFSPACQTANVKHINTGKYLSHSIANENHKIEFDNFGCVSVCKKSEARKRITDGALDLFVKSNGKTVALSKCDVSVLPHKAVYRYVSANAEIAAEFIAPIECSCCCCKLTVINRSDKSKDIDISAVYSLYGERSNDMKKTADAAMSVANADGEVYALIFDRSANYEKTLTEVACEHDFRLSSNRKQCLIGTTSVALHGFEKQTVVLSLANGSSVREVLRMAEYVNDAGYFDYENMRAEIFSQTQNRERGQNLLSKNVNDIHEVVSRFAQYENSDDLPNVNCVLQNDHGGFMCDGSSVIEAGGALRIPLNYDLFDGKIGVKCSQNGINGLYTKPCLDGITFSDGRLTECAPVNIVIGENGSLWSPTMLPLGNGKMRATHGFSNVLYENAFNGCISALKCYIARGKNAVIFDLTIDNLLEVKRDLEIMFSVRPSVGATASVRGSTIEIESGAKSFKVYSSQKPICHAMFLEEYMSHGEICRVGEFTGDGAVVAPAITVGAELAPFGQARTIFCIVADDESEISPMGMSASDADNYLHLEKEFVENMFRIKLLSDDVRLNIMYRRALYQSHVYGFLKSEGLSTFDLCAVLAAEKYIDKTAVKSKLKSLLSEQTERGEYRGDFRDALYIAYAVTDYVTFAADYGFLDELVEYAPRRAHGRKITLKTTVAEHCMRAVDGNIFQNVFNYDKTVRGIFDCKILGELLRCFADIPNASAERKERYIAMLGKVAATYSEETERLKNRSLYALNSLRATFTCARLLFESGEYDKSYNLLKYNNPLYARKSSDPNIIQKSFFTENDSSTCGATAAAMFFTTVTECLVGLKLHGDKISIMPMIGGETPHLRVELDTGDGRAKIDVDNSIKRGEWRIKLDRISYSAANVELRGRGDAGILLYRSGDGTID